MATQDKTASRILIVDDEKDITEVISFNLKKNGFAVSVAYTAEDASEIIKSTPVDLIILDLMLPGMNGLEFCRILKNDTATQNIQIIMLTAKGTEDDIVKGLEFGADDYVTKPFSPAVLSARVNAVMKRASKSSGSGVLSLHGIEISHDRREVRVNSDKIQLTYSEYEILYLLMNHPGWVFTRGQIVDKVRGEDYPVTERTVDVHLFGLRKKLGLAGENIETIRGVGYRMTE